MNQSSLNKIVDVQGLSLALAKTKADYMRYANIKGALVVNITYNSTTDTYSADRTYNEIVARINNGGYVYAIYNGSIFELSHFHDGNIGFATAFSLDTDDRFMGASSFSINSSNVIDFGEHNDSYLSSVNLNGSETTFPQFYAPTTVGTSGQVLTSSGSGAPTWSNVSTPSAATATPLMDGTAAVGSSSKYAKEDHVHPSDTKKANASDVDTLSRNVNTVTTISSTPLTFSDDTWTISKVGSQLTRDGYYGSGISLTYKGALRFILVSNNGTGNPFTNQLFVLSNVLSQEYAEYTLDGIVDDKVYHLVVKMNTNSSATILSHAVYDISSSSLSGLTDTTISSPTNGQVLSYDTSTSKWKNATIPTGATYTLSMTNNVITLTGSDGSTSSVTLPVYGGEVDAVWEGGSY